MVLVGVATSVPIAFPAWGLVIDQLTDHIDSSCVMLAPDSDAAGRYIAFESSCDLLDNNSDGNREIFRYDRTTNSIEQITDTTGCASTHPAISGDGNRIVFDSDCDITGTNSDENIEIYLLDGVTLKQLSTSALCSNLSPDIDGTGDVIVFASDCPYSGVVGSEIYRVTAAAEIEQLTFNPSASDCGSFEASVSADGSLIAFESDCDLTGTNEDENQEIFSVTLNGAVTQLTADLADSGCITGSPNVDGGGAFVVFESNCDPFGTNQDESIEIFKVEVGGMSEQLTDDVTDSGCSSRKPRIFPDGSAVTFASDCDLVGQNDDGNTEVFQFTALGTEQLTDSAACTNFDATSGGDSNEPIYVSDCDPSGINDDGSDELFAIGPCVCGGPMSAKNPPIATDALFTLNAAVGLAVCALCECDVDNSGRVSATDALLVLNAAVGMGVPLVCP